MILTAHQPTYLPWLGLFHKIAISDLFVSYNQVQYQVDNWNNRNKIQTRVGVKWLTVPVLHKNHLNTTINSIRIDNAAPWRRKHWKTIQHAYGKAPYFKNYADFFEHIYSKEWIYLSELNEEMLKGLLYILRIRVPILSAKDYNFQGEKSDRVLDMCKQLNAREFIFGALGKEYAKVDDFQKAGIKISFQNYSHPSYTQPGGGNFTSHLSIIDLLFNCGENSYDIIMEGNIKPTTSSFPRLSI